MLPGRLLQDDLLARPVVGQLAQHDFRETSNCGQNLLDRLIVSLSCEFSVFGIKFVPILEDARLVLRGRKI